MPSEKHQKQARKALSVRTLTPTQMEDCIPSVAAALESAYAEGKRDAAARCAEMARLRIDTDFVDGSRIYRNGWRHCAQYIGAEIRAEFGIAVEEKTNG